MTPRISCYVVIATLIWSAHTQNEERVRDDMFKSNMTRNDFSKLLSSLIKLNEQRVSVLQKLYKLEDYGVLSEVLRSGDKKPENGSPNNLYLIVMSKNETAPSRRPLDFEIVDTVKSLDVGSKMVHPKLDYVLDPASYISQNTNKKTSMESIFTNIPTAHGSKQTHLINDASKKNINTIKFLKFRKPRQNSKERDNTNILRNKRTGLKTNKEMKNRYKNSKFEIPNKEEWNDYTSEELQDYDENSKEYPAVGYGDPHYSEIYVTKIIETKKSSNNNLKHLLQANDRQGENDYDSPFSKEFTNNSSKGQDAKAGSYISMKNSNGIRNLAIFNNQASIVRTDKKSITNKNYLRMASTVKSDKTDTLSNGQNKKNNFEHKNEEDEYNNDSPFGREYDGNDTNRKYTEMYSDISIKRVNDNKNPKPKRITANPKIIQRIRNFHFNRSKSIMNQSNAHFTVMTEIKTSTNKNNLRLISPLNNSKTITQHNDQEDENNYGSSFSKEYDDISQNRQNSKIDSPKINDKKYPKLNQNKPGAKMYSTKKTVIATSSAKNDIPISITLNSVNVTENNYSEKPNLNRDIKKSKIRFLPRDKLPSQATKKPFHRQLHVTLKVLPYKNDHDYPKDVGNDTNSVNFADKESKNTTNPDNKKTLSRIENIDGVNTTTDPTLHLKDVTKNTNEDKTKTAKDLDNGNIRNVESKPLKKIDTKKKFDENGELMIDKKDGQDFSIVITHVENNKSEIKPEETKPTNLRIDSKEFNQPDGKPIERKAIQRCLNKKANKLCRKSCISAYKNVCRRLKCTSKAKKALKKECMHSCKKTFASSSSKYSDESNSDSDSDYS